MEVISLQSGSSGNCLYVESGDERVLIDAGITGRQVEERLKLFGKDARELTALIISHDHGDHTRSLGVVHRKFDLPIYVSRPTLRVVQRYKKQGTLSRVHFFTAGNLFVLVSYSSIRFPHRMMRSTEWRL